MTKRMQEAPSSSDIKKIYYFTILFSIK